jgi:tungstate transport system substrate-binding protein
LYAPISAWPSVPVTNSIYYLAFKDKIDLVILNEGDKALFNPYHIITVNPAKHKHVQYDMAKKYIEFVTGTEGQALIGAYKKHGEQLFYPDAL